MRLKSVLLFTLFILTCNFSLHAKDIKNTVSTNNIAYQYTSDGYLQHLGVYPDAIIGTNVEGPREGVQIILMDNGALVDMCNTYKQTKNYMLHRYKWGEVRTYKTYQSVIVK